MGALGDDNNGSSSGNVRVLSGSDGSVIYSLDGDSVGDRFGTSVSGVGDINGDGVADFIVGAEQGGANNGGYARVFVSQVNPALNGDVNLDGVVDCSDVDAYIGLIGTPAGANTALDLVVDGNIDFADVDFLIENLVMASDGSTGTVRGDFNCDGSVDILGDAFILVGNLNSANSRYRDGDATLDGQVDVLGDAFILIGNLD